ncbi:SGNH/GDSL hydrolase family protein [Campylobacter sp. RM9939]|uniref:hypothetical protein n=1 Tax=Campylobacter molothri TaxID=1032242 RepID=UPI001D73DE3F|nr:SGNH/GDSL hydrolase family protein [Campylobacter sp. RM10536]MBZ7953126.1 SGNH/GDSL hydrolase family protein [Campylobacter sp. RM9939]MBZ7957506.1 SGNH/GDSL hydrolase family protein [Campylobacter sp. RM10541]
MDKKNVVLLGGSNSVIVNGLQRGLREGIEQFNQHYSKKLKFHNFALGATTSLQNLYELKRDRNKIILENAKLIISESNINDSFCYDNSKIYKTVELLFNELSQFKTKILILILPFFNLNSKIVNQIHKKLALKFGFNIIDINSYYENFNLSNFSFLREKDGSHQFDFIYKRLGNNIISNIEKLTICNSNNNSKFNLKICQAKEIDETVVYNRSNSIFNEKCIRLFDSNLFKFPSKYEGFELIGCHCWTTEEDSDIQAPLDWLGRRGI